MTENPPTTNNPELPASEGWPDYPGFGSPDDVQARIKLLQWISTQEIEGNVGDYILATDGRILGVGPNIDELSEKIFAAEPELQNARIVVSRIQPMIL
ncbi:MAG: hypothetical protein L0241_13730 [Planctomycetia bacterium]|nr:hypothetical protein [Planctomycetia bacterium]